MGSVKQKIEIEIEVLQGYEVIDFRPPLNDELFLSDQDFKTVLRANVDFTTPKFILRKVKRYREPVLPADAHSECEVSDDLHDWFSGVLLGFNMSTNHVPYWYASIDGDRIDGDRRNWRHCRIEVSR